MMHRPRLPTRGCCWFHGTELEEPPSGPAKRPGLGRSINPNPRPVLAEAGVRLPRCAAASISDVLEDLHANDASYRPGWIKGEAGRERPASPEAKVFRQRHLESSQERRTGAPWSERGETRGRFGPAPDGRTRTRGVADPQPREDRAGVRRWGWRRRRARFDRFMRSTWAASSSTRILQIRISTAFGSCSRSRSARHRRMKCLSVLSATCSASAISRQGTLMARAMATRWPNAIASRIGRSRGLRR